MLMGYFATAAEGIAFTERPAAFYTRLDGTLYFTVRPLIAALCGAEQFQSS